LAQEKPALIGRRRGGVSDKKNKLWRAPAPSGGV